VKFAALACRLGVASGQFKASGKRPFTDAQALVNQPERQLAKADELMNALMAGFFGNGVGIEAAA